MKIEYNSVGMWRSLVAHFAWDEGVARSNRVIPTIYKKSLEKGSFFVDVAQFDSADEED